jgi:hypothetical protein
MQICSPNINRPHALLFIVTVLLLNSFTLGQDLQTSYTNQGLQTLTYDGITLLDLSPGHSEGDWFRPRGTPITWLLSTGLAGDLGAAEETDHDQDGHEAWQEYVTGTDPAPPPEPRLFYRIALAGPQGT